MLELTKEEVDLVKAWRKSNEQYKKAVSAVLEFKYESSTKKGKGNIVPFQQKTLHDSTQQNCTYYAIVES